MCEMCKKDGTITVHFGLCIKCCKEMSGSPSMNMWVKQKKGTEVQELFRRFEK